MGKLTETLANHTLLGLDTSIFIYHMGVHPDYITLTRELLDGIERGRWQGVSSVITLLEIAVLPYQMEQEQQARRTEALWINFPNLAFADIDRSIAHRAARLRAAYRLRTPDSLQIAACLLAGASVFVTNDRRLARISALLPVLILDDYRLE